MQRIFKSVHSINYKNFQGKKTDNEIKRNKYSKFTARKDI
jgi:hypothetical protein